MSTIYMCMLFCIENCQTRNTHRERFLTIQSGRLSSMFDSTQELVFFVVRLAVCVSFHRNVIVHQIIGFIYIVRISQVAINAYKMPAFLFRFY